ncbi:hypothetical protein HDU87_008411 [Geranomyces variabilis]|uniref:Uncharacterized protein n=1 Tax=Geranomyces variabilis TaxID=109894 RepID=A0AAD5TEH3_9FUNG|nr:hypothetical protein HDU87_008411 [Geranomyces variabilis]
MVSTRTHPAPAEEGGPSADFVFNYRKSSIPKVLSRRYQRLHPDVAAPRTTASPQVAADRITQPPPANGDSSDEEPTTAPRASRQPQRGDTANRGVPRGNPSATTTHQQPPPPAIAATAATLSGPTSARQRSRRSASPPLPAIRPYAPFHLHPTSSFAPSASTPSIPHRPAAGGAAVVAARYASYAQPCADVTQTIERTDQRARAAERAKRAAARKEVEAAREKYYGGREEKERKARRMAELARERMTLKFKQALMMRENEVRHLVEGQQNSIDAILLKEHLALRPHRHVDMRGIYTEDDRLRVDRIIAG